MHRVRFLGIGETCDLGDLYVGLTREGHEVRVHASEPLAQGTLAGMAIKVADWRAELDWIRAAPDLGVILFESVSNGFGALQDQLRAQGFNVIGGSAYGDRLENDRAYAQGVLAELGFPGGHVWQFDRPAEAQAFVDEHPARYVVKFSGPDFASSDNYIGQWADGGDVSALLRARIGKSDKPQSLILMAFIEGVEMGVGAYFNGERFIRPACLDWEHKRFFPGDMGELTGEMGTVVTYERSDRFFDLTLARMESRLRAAGHVGYVNLNTIVNAAGIWPLEFSCRFGYPGFAILSPLQTGGWGALLRAMVTRSPTTHATDPGFCVGIVLTTPPFPYTRKQIDEPIGLPVLIEHQADSRHVHYGEVGLDASGQLVTSGLYGWTLVITGTGETIGQARHEAYEHAGAVSIPNVRYRLDIGDRLIHGEFHRLEGLGLLDPVGPAMVEEIA